MVVRVLGNLAPSYSLSVTSYKQPRHCKTVSILLLETQPVNKFLQPSQMLPLLNRETTSRAAQSRDYAVLCDVCAGQKLQKHIFVSAVIEYQDK
jgi:hypothetical protein